MTGTDFGPEGTALWESIAGGKYDLRPDDLVVLARACETADMIASLDAAWTKLDKPFLTKGSMGQDVIHPLIGERRTQAAALASLLRQLKLPDDAAGAAVNQNRAAGYSRWGSAHGTGG